MDATVSYVCAYLARILQPLTQFCNLTLRPENDSTLPRKEKKRLAKIPSLRERSPLIRGLRDNAAFGETGGAYSIYHAMAFGPDGAMTGPDVTCVAN